MAIAENWKEGEDAMFYVIQHVPEEGAGLFTELMPAAHRVIIAGAEELPSVTRDDVVLIMGGPMGVYEKARYLFIKKELAFIQQCCEIGARVLGVCLGAQMIAEALGGRAYKGHLKETGWFTITHTGNAAKDPAFSIFQKRSSVFQWHQDTFDLPRDAVRLAYSDNYHNQAFRVGKRIYGLQYHIEATAAMLNEWFPGARGTKMIDLDRLNALKPLALEFFRRFLSTP